MILITGAHGTLGRALARICATRGLPHRATTHAELDITNARAVERVMSASSVTAVINGSGYVRVDDAEKDELACMRANTEGPATLARACAKHDVPLLTFSSDLVFGGDASAPFVESDAPRPRNVYGLSKAIAERLVLAEHPRAIVVRTSAFFGPWDEWNFVTRALDSFARGETVRVGRQIVSPTYVVDLANASLDLLLDRDARGVFHVANRGAVSWRELAILAARTCGARANVEEHDAEVVGWVATRPPYTALASERGVVLPTLEDALSRYARARQLCA